MANTNMERCLPSLMFIQTEVYVWGWGEMEAIATFSASQNYETNERIPEKTLHMFF